MASTYDEAARVKKYLSQLIRECIESNETIKSCVKARRAIVTTAANTTVANKVGVKLIGDNTELFLPYNSTFTASDLTVNTLVSVWYSYGVNNGIVMKNAKWTN